MKTNKRHGMGTLVLPKGRKTFIARWVVAGKVFTKSTGTANRKEAERVLEDLTAPFAARRECDRLANIAARIAGIKEELRLHEERKPALSISQAWQAYLRNLERPQGTTPATLANYESGLKRFANWMRKHHPDVSELRAVSQDIASEYARCLSEVVSANTFNRHLSFFRCLWRVLADQARLPLNPWTKIKKKAGEVQSRRVLSEEELRRLCSAAQGEMRTLFAVGIYTGLRLGDAVCLNRSQVDDRRGLLMLTPRKTRRTGKSVVIPIHPELASVLREVPPASDGYFMPCLAAEYRHYRGAVSKRVQAFFLANGIETKGTAQGRRCAAVLVGFHSLRHTFVSIAGNAGMPLALVQSIVGHTTPEMTRHYFHESTDALRGVVAAIPGSLLGAKSIQP